MSAQFKVGDLVVVTRNEGYEEYCSKGDVARCIEDDYFDFNNQGNSKVYDDGYWYINLSNVREFKPIEDLPLWKANYMYLNDEQQQALRNLLHRVQWDEEYVEKIEMNLERQSILFAFDWNETEEGMDYWDEVEDQVAGGLAQQKADVSKEEQSKPNGGSSALATQEGGSHYKKCGIQPVEYIQANGLDYFQGNVIKYTTRHKDKNGEEDIKKAIHYLQLILELQYSK